MNFLFYLYVALLHYAPSNKYNLSSESYVYAVQTYILFLKYFDFKKSIAVKMATIQKTRNNKGWQRCGEKETLTHYFEECKLVHHYRKQNGSSSKS